MSRLAPISNSSIKPPFYIQEMGRGEGRWAPRPPSTFRPPSVHPLPPPIATTAWLTFFKPALWIHWQGSSVSQKQILFQSLALAHDENLHQLSPRFLLSRPSPRLSHSWIQLEINIKISILTILLRLLETVTHGVGWHCDPWGFSSACVWLGAIKRRGSVGGGGSKRASARPGAIAPRHSPATNPRRWSVKDRDNIDQLLIEIQRPLITDMRHSPIHRPIDIDGSRSLKFFPPPPRIPHTHTHTHTHTLRHTQQMENK